MGKSKLGQPVIFIMEFVPGRLNRLHPPTLLQGEDVFPSGEGGAGMPLLQIRVIPITRTAVGQLERSEEQSDSRGRGEGLALQTGIYCKRLRSYSTCPIS
ncbi:MAG: hypothetical protein FD153_1575 [Rhodospirillaceae bacterium]|nr:MAG: hypothetical protein FD153_1575 [Rhodospirillaceae bacterium]